LIARVLKSTPKFYFFKRAAWLLFLLNSSSLASQVRVVEKENCLKFVTSSNSELLALQKLSFLKGLSYSEKVASRFGSYRFKRKESLSFTGISSDTLIRYGNDYFLIGKLADRFPVEVGFFFDTLVERKFWISVKVEDSSEVLQSLEVSFATDARHFWGGGEQFSIIDFAGKQFVGVVEENGIGRGDLPVSKLTKWLGICGNKNSTYFPLPCFCTEKKFCFQVTPAECNARFDTLGNISLEIIPYRKSSFWLLNIDFDEWGKLNAAERHSLPNWSYGTILGLQGGAQRVEKILDEALRAGNPVTAVWIQDWVGKRKVSFGSRLWWSWHPDTVAYPDLKSWIQKMNQKGVKVLGYINPFIISESKYFKEALEKKYLVQHINGKPYRVKAGGFSAYPVDLLNPEAAEWYKTVIRQTLIENGFSGWMADFGEWFPFDVQIPDGMNTHAAHNFYPVVWARIQREVLRENHLDDSILVFHRSGHRGSGKWVKLFWAGDQTTDFGVNDGLPSAVKAVLSSSVSGVLLNHSDVGGYTNIHFGKTKVFRSRELLYRWIEFEAFTPVFRTHEGLKPDKNIQVYSDSSAVHFFARFGKIHYLLRDYFKSCIESGIVIQPFFTSFTSPKDSLFSYQFLVGNDLLVAPVVKPSQTELAVRFFEGTWRHIFNSQSPYYNGTSVEVISCPLGKPAVFVRAGSRLDELLLLNRQLFE
jgi:alpha-glucosidase